MVVQIYPDISRASVTSVADTVSVPPGVVPERERV